MDAMLYEGNTNINRVCGVNDANDVNANCIRVSPVTIDAQYQLLGVNKDDIKTNDSVSVTSHFHTIGSKSDKFPKFDVAGNNIDSVADNYYG